jgi:hypothetical protein
MEIAEHMEVNEVARRTGMAARFWKDHAKNGIVKGFRLGNRIVLEIVSVNAFLEARTIKRLEQPSHLRRRQR